MSTPDISLAERFHETTATYVRLREETVAAALGPTVMAEAAQIVDAIPEELEQDILGSLSEAERELYDAAYRTLESDVYSARKESWDNNALFKVQAARAKFDIEYARFVDHGGDYSPHKIFLDGLDLTGINEDGQNVYVTVRPSNKRTTPKIIDGLLVEKHYLDDQENLIDMDLSAKDYEEIAVNIAQLEKINALLSGLA